MIALVIGNCSPGTRSLTERLAERNWKSLIADDFEAARSFVEKHEGSFSLVVIDPSWLNMTTLAFVAELRQVHSQLMIFTIADTHKLPMGLRALLPEGTYILRETESEYFERMLECVTLSSRSLLPSSKKVETV